MSTKWQKFTIDIPEDYGPSDREAIAQEIIDHIIERTKKGIDKDGDSFKPYSKSYTKSLNFKIAGKDKDDVNLTLSGDMLGAMTLLKSSKGKLVLGFEKGSHENAIADGNIRGTYGHSKPIGKGRDFLGISDKELESVLSDFPTDQENQDNRDLENELVGAAQFISKIDVQNDGGEDE